MKLSDKLTKENIMDKKVEVGSIKFENDKNFIENIPSDDLVKQFGRKPKKVKKVVVYEE